MLGHNKFMGEVKGHTNQVTESLNWFYLKSPEIFHGQRTELHLMVDIWTYQIDKRHEISTLFVNKKGNTN